MDQGTMRRRASGDNATMLPPIHAPEWKSSFE